MLAILRSPERARRGQNLRRTEVSGDAGDGATDLRQSIFQLMAAFKQVAMAGNDAQRKRTAELLDETRRKIYALLASDES